MGGANVPISTEPTTASGIREALHKRWPPGEYVVIEEAPDDSSRMGRKIDLLVVSCWRSRGFGVDAVEIKVSMTDWKRELAKAAKADFWWRHCDRFWIAVPAKIAPKVRDQLPEAWGLLVVSADGIAREMVQAPKHEREALSWSTTIGVLRATQNAGFGALQRAEAKGYQRGSEDGKRHAEGATLTRAHAELRERVAEFERITGLSVSSRPNHERFGFASPEDLRDAVAAVVQDANRGARARAEMRATVDRLRAAADQVERILEPEAVPA